VTSGLAAIHLAGPRSRELLQRLTSADLSPDAFRFLDAKEIEAGWATAWALRVSYTGELGYELYVPAEFAADLYEKVVATGEDLGLRHAGAFAFDALRLERGFRSWGHDIGQLDDPFASGLGFATDPAKDTPALAGLRAAAPERRLVSLHVPDGTLWHGEPVLRDGERIGHVTSGGPSATLGGSVGLAWIHGPHADGPVEVEIRARNVAGEIRERSFVDPTGERLVS
jgi:glycine cleavage system aminomethyltransferase T